MARRSRGRAGETVLVHGTGGVAPATDAMVIITSGSDAKLERVRALGPAVRAINYRRSSDVAAEVMALTGGEGADHVMETVGGANLDLSLAAVRIGGAISVIGPIGGQAAEVDTDEFVTRNVTVHGIETGSHEMYAEPAAFVDEHGVVPLLDSVHPVERVRDALRHVERGGHVGEVVVALAAELETT